MNRSVAPPLPLALLDRGSCATVDTIVGEGGLQSRLAELGFVPGARIRMVAPGEPCVIALGAARLALRGAEVDALLVRAG